MIKQQTDMELLVTVQILAALLDLTGDYTFNFRHLDVTLIFEENSNIQFVEVRKILDCF